MFTLPPDALLSFPARMPAAVIFRSPLLSVTGLHQFFNSLHHQSAASVLADFYRADLVAQALYVASPSLYREWETWSSQSPESVAGLRRNVEIALFKYAVRMSSRPTPFGLFSGLGIARPAPDTSIIRSGATTRAVTRIDGNGLVQCYDRIMAEPGSRERLRYRINNSLYRFGSEWRFSEFSGTGQQRSVQLSAIEANDLLESLTAHADQYRSFGALSALIEQVADTTPDQARQYLHALIDAQFLLSELEPTVTGIAYGERLAATLADWPDRSRFVDEFLALNPAANQPLGDQTLQRIDDWFDHQGFIAHNRQSFLHTNLYYTPATARINAGSLDQVRAQVNRLAGLFAQPEPRWLLSFKERFYARYQQQAVPLLLALDNDAGVGIQPVADFSPANAPLLNAVARMLHTASIPARNKTPVLDTLRRKLFSRGLQHRGQAVTLTPSDLLPFTNQRPAAWSILGSLLAADAAAVDSGDFSFLLRSVQGPSPALLLGRFCQDSAELTDLVRDALAREQALRPGVVLAEVAHLTVGRAGNVNARPTLRPYEIPYLTPASTDADHTLELPDLLLQMTDSQTLVLRSRRLNQVVVPQLTSAHNTVVGDDIYRFLTELGRHPAGLGGGWTWGDWRKEPCLPRVVYQQIIVSRAQWCINPSHLTEHTSFDKVLTYFRERYGLPAQVILLTDTDNELVLDTDLALARDLLTAQLRSGTEVTLVEWVNPASQCWLSDEEGDVYTQELVIPVTGEPDPVRPVAFQPLHEEQAEQTILPGGEWFYFKWYTGPQTAEALLQNELAPLIDLLLRESLITEWFFVRYYDPEYHLRIRLKRPETSANDPVSLGTLLQHVYRVSDTGRRQGLIHSLQLDTYQRETHRYGPRTTELCETLFHYDSNALNAFLAVTDFPGEAERMHFALLSAVALLEDFDYSPTQAAEFCVGRQQSYWQEFGGGKTLKDTLNELFRTYRPLVDGWMAESAGQTAYQSVLTKRSGLNKPVCALILSRLAGQSSGEQTRIVASLLHMSLNRLFVSQLRMNELIVYHFLARHLQATNAQRKTGTRS